MMTRTLVGMALALWLPASQQAQAQPPAPAAQAPVPELSAEQWRDDLRFMAAEMERRHANLYHSVSRERFAAAVADLDARIPRLQRNQIIVGMMRIAAMVGDGHSRVDPRKDARFAMPSLPLRLYLFEDGLYVRAAAPALRSLVGARVEAIGGVPVDEAIRRAAEISSRDNEVGPRLVVPLYLNMPDILHALGLSTRRDRAVLRLRKGNRSWSETVPAGEVAPLWPPDTDASFITPEGWADARTTPQPPLWLQAPLDYHRMIDLPDRRALYVQLNMVTDVPGQSLAQFARRIGERAREANPRALILDLRLNHGGNGYLRTPLVRELIRAEDEDTRLFVLTWRGTFSASQFILDDLDRLTGAIFIGEPASSRPSSFGDAYRMPMPNSGIAVRSSIYWWQQGQNRDPWTWVDVATPLTFADYAAGTDPALEAALGYTPRPTLREQLLATASSSGAAGIRSALAAYRADVANRYANLALELPRSAEILYNMGRREEGLMVAELAAEQFPDNVDAFNVLAHLSEAAGRREIAARAGARVLQLDPNNRSVRPLMERLHPPQ
jgi:tetratricopeptide (TPR) repeat protein